jgi:sialic acid synthase SpsE
MPIRTGDYLDVKSHPPFIIAEMSCNHSQSLDRALELVEVATKTGVHEIKVHTYTADTVTLYLSENGFLYI